MSDQQRNGSLVTFDDGFQMIVRIGDYNIYGAAEDREDQEGEPCIDPGPQKRPSSIGKIQAECRVVEREMGGA